MMNEILELVMQY